MSKSLDVIREILENAVNVVKDNNEIDDLKFVLQEALTDLHLKQLAIKQKQWKNKKDKE